MMTPQELEFGITFELLRMHRPKGLSKRELAEYSMTKWAWEDMLEYVRKHQNLLSSDILENYIKRVQELSFSASDKTKGYFLTAYDLADWVLDLLY